MPAPLRVAAFLCASLLSAQQAPFIPITGPNSPASAHFLFEDRRGGLWLGGVEALPDVRYFDGTHFTLPFSDSRPPQILVEGMAEDSEGGIWFAGLPSGIYRLSHGHIQKMFDAIPSFGFIAVAPNVFVANVVATARQNEAQLARIEKIGGVWKIEALAKSPPDIRLFLDSLGNIVYPCQDGYCDVRTQDIKDWRTGTTLPITRHPMPLAFLPVAAFRDRAGCVWARSLDQTAYQCPADRAPVVLPYSIASAGAPDIAEMNDGSLVIPSFGCLAVGRPGHFRILTAANGYPGAAHILVGKDDSIWLSNANGLFVLPSQVRIEYWTEHDGLDGNTWSILPMGDDVLALSGDRINVLDKDRARWHAIGKFGGARHLADGGHHTVLVSSRSEGLMQMDIAGQILAKSAPASVATLARTPDGTIWSTGKELASVKLHANQLILQPVTPPDPAGGIDLKTDSGGGLWNCNADGLGYRGSVGNIHLSSRDGLPPGYCRSMAIDLAGNVWYGADHFALIRNPLSPQRKVDWFPLEWDPSHFLNIDNKGRLWRGTATGVYVAEPEQAARNRWLHLGRDNGLPGNDTNSGSFILQPDGSVWFGIDNSVIHILPADDLVHPAYAPSVFVSGYSWDNGPFQMADDVASVPHGAKLTAHLGSLQMDRRSAMQIRYRLEPEQSSWTVARDVDVTLGKLSWGTHQLDVQARLGDGPWSKTALETFEVQKPIWLYTPSLLGFTLGGMLAMAGSQYWRIRRRKRTAMPLPGLAAWRAAALAPESRGLEGKLLDGRFKVSAMLSRGGFGTVWKATDRRQSGKACAVKVFRQELLDNAWMMKRFQQEVAALTQINHPNVVGIYGHGRVSSGAPYLAMEFIEGNTLRQQLNESKLNRPQIANYLRQISSALTEIHAHGICHRDVKPENLMLRATAPPRTELVLIDFSIAIVQDPDETIHGLSRAAGTFYYMAPEQAIGYANASSDIYSLAKIVIEMLTGERLSVLLPNASIDLAARVRELLIHSHLNLSEESIDLLASTLEYDPAKRPNRADIFGATIAADLEMNK